MNEENQYGYSQTNYITWKMLLALNRIPYWDGFSGAVAYRSYQ